MNLASFPVVRSAIATFGFALFAVACIAQSGDPAATSSSEIVADGLGVYFTCIEDCSASSEAACPAPACNWSVAGNGCNSSGVCNSAFAQESEASCLESEDAGPSGPGCQWVNGACTQATPCPTSADTTEATCVAANAQCYWSAAATSCSATTYCATYKPTGEFCPAGCKAIAHVTGSGGGCIGPKC